MKLKSKLGLALLGIMAVALVVVIWWWHKERYQVVRPTRGEVIEAVYALGKVRAYRHFEVILGVMSQVQTLHVEEGDMVLAGEPLIRFTQGGIFRAPFGGTVTLVKVRPQEVAQANTVLLRMDDLNDCFIELSLEQQTALRVRKGQPVRASFEELRGEVLSGVVDAIFPREDEFLAHVRVKGLNAGVLPGMTADVTVEIGRTPKALLIPFRALSNGSVTVKVGGKWVRRKVRLGNVSLEQAEVLDGSLSESDELRVPKEE